MEEFGEFPQLETDRLILREMTLDDVEFYFRHFNNDKVVEGCCFPGPKTLEAAKEELERYCIKPFKENRGIRWGLVRKGGSELIGTCSYYDWIKAARRAEIGYDLDPTYWGQGIITEALRAVLKYGFEKIGLNRIQAIIDSKNTSSLKLVHRLGFKKEGVFRERSYFNGQFRDDVCLSLLRKEWTKT
ncbi:MAG: N-acetyltransferase [Candidatus Bathyarchaeum sp.]|nr:MAG: N-acetyltransferase [Candidatus Bathyarchaeum sp.]